MLSTDTGTVNLRAEYEAETINLKWYNDDTRVNVATASNSCIYDTAISLPTNPTKPGYKFKGWKAIPGTRIEYLQSTGTQWINMGTHPTVARKMEVVGQVVQYVNNSFLFGVTDGDRYGWGMIYDKFMWNYGVWNISDIDVDFNKHTFGIDTTTNKVWVDNNKFTPTVGYYGESAYFTANTINIYLFARYNRGTVEGFSRLKIYSVKMWDNNGTLVRDMIPIKDTDGVACMYDFVSKQKFYNAGTGDFGAGPEI